MSGFLQGVAAVGLLSLFLAVLPLFTWPDIALYLTAVSVVFNYFFFFNEVFPVDTIFTILFLILTIELSLFFVRFLTKIMGFITGGNLTHKE